MKECAYCGEIATTKDHIVPVSYYYSGERKGKNRHFTSEYGKENLVDCCIECNCIAGNKIFMDFYEKKDFIQNRLKEKYKKAVNCPNWTDKEIAEMGYKFRKEIKIQQLARKWVLNRINYPIDIYPTVLFNKDIKKFLDSL